MRAKLPQTLVVQSGPGDLVSVRNASQETQVSLYLKTLYFG